MSVVNFELKDDHIKLLRNISWTLKYGDLVLKRPFLDDDSELLVNVYEDVDLILNGNVYEIDALGDQSPVYSEQQKLVWDNLLSELPTAMDVILYTGKFEIGMYKTKFHVRSWKKVVS